MDTFKYFAEHVAPVPDDHDPSDKMKALGLAYKTDTHYLGVYYQPEPAPLNQRLPLARQQVETDRQTMLEELLARFG